MKKLYIIILAVLFAFSAVVFAQDAAKETSFKGRVIFCSDTGVEIKMGKTEVKLQFSADTKIVDINGKEAGKEAIEVCQTAKVFYTGNILNKIVILKKNDCKK